jgi:hypothetical protein
MVDPHILYVVYYTSHIDIKLLSTKRYATRRKVAGSRPDDVNEFFQFI